MIQTENVVITGEFYGVWNNLSDVRNQKFLKNLQESQRLLGRNCEFKSKKLLWGEPTLQNGRRMDHINEMPINVS